MFIYRLYNNNSFSLPGNDKVCISASFSVLVVGFLPWDWSARGRGEGLMAAVFAVNSVCMILIATTKNIWLAYVLYDVFRATYHGVLTMAA